MPSLSQHGVSDKTHDMEIFVFFSCESQVTEEGVGEDFNACESITLVGIGTYPGQISWSRQTETLVFAHVLVPSVRAEMELG